MPPAQIVKSYPSIDPKVRRGVYYMFAKPDGSNLRAEWDRKKGFWKFGKRQGLLDHSNPHLLCAPDLIRAKYEEAMSRIFVGERWKKATAFFELWGPQSFAGNHVEGDALDVTLFDVAAENRGLLEPRPYLRLFEGVPHADLLYHGNITAEVEEQVRSGTFPGMPFEGVVCKGAYASPGLPSMFKIKNRAWLERLRAYCSGDEELFSRLA